MRHHLSQGPRAAIHNLGAPMRAAKLGFPRWWENLKLCTKNSGSSTLRGLPQLLGFPTYFCMRYFKHRPLI